MAHVGRLVGMSSHNRKFVASVPGQGTHPGCGPVWAGLGRSGRQPIDVFLSLTLSLPLSLKAMKNCPQVRIKKKFFFKILFNLDRGKRRENERERNINVWWTLTPPPLGTWPTTQACAVAGNQTSNPLVPRPVLNPLSHTGQG